MVRVGFQVGMHISNRVAVFGNTDHLASSVIYAIINSLFLLGLALSFRHQTCYFIFGSFSICISIMPESSNWGYW